MGPSRRFDGSRRTGVFGNKKKGNGDDEGSWEEVCEVAISIQGVPVAGVEVAKVAYFYKLNPEQLTPELFFLLQQCLPEVQAYEEVHLRTINAPLTPESLNRLVLALTGDRDKADMAEAKAWLKMDKERLTKQ